MDLITFIKILTPSIHTNRTRTIIGPLCFAPHLNSQTTDSVLTLIRDTDPETISSYITSVPEWKSGMTHSKVIQSLYTCMSESRVKSESKLDPEDIVVIMNKLKAIGNAFNSTYTRASRQLISKEKPCHYPCTNFGDCHHPCTDLGDCHYPCTNFGDCHHPCTDLGDCHLPLTTDLGECRTRSVKLVDDIYARRNRSSPKAYCMLGISLNKTQYQNCKVIIL